MGNTEILTQSSAEHLLHKYLQEYDLILCSKDNVSCILKKLMYENGFECDKKTFEDIVDTLIIYYL